MNMWSIWRTMLEGLREITSEDAKALRAFIRKAVDDAGAKGVVLGISGGVDSAVAAKLCVDALGGDRVLCVFMPTSNTPAVDFKQTRDLCRTWDSGYTTVNIQRSVDAFSGMLLTGKEAPLEKGNIMARCRMIVLYDKAKKEGYLVVGTTNRSELLMGYMTKFGDGAEDIMPMAGLYKTQVWQLASQIGVPQEIIDKTPTAGLWEGQTDEEEMGISYHDLDLALNAIEDGATDSDVADVAGITLEKVGELRRQISKMSHKYEPPLIPEDVKLGVGRY